LDPDQEFLQKRNFGQPCVLDEKTGENSDLTGQRKGRVKKMAERTAIRYDFS
jgi:hypothetical protein